MKAIPASKYSFSRFYTSQIRRIHVVKWVHIRVRPQRQFLPSTSFNETRESPCNRINPCRRIRIFGLATPSTLLGPRKRLPFGILDTEAPPTRRNGFPRSVTKSRSVAPFSPLSLVNRSRLISPTSRWRPAENSHPREEELDPFQLNRVFRESAGFRVERMQFPRESFPLAEGNYGNIGNE